MGQITREDTHEALACLYRTVELAQTGLAKHFAEVQAAPDLKERGARIRALILNAIEVLRPARRFPFGSLESRCYDVLSLRYVENMSVRQMAKEMSLSERQVHRDLLRAEERLAAVLNARSGPSSSDQGPNQLEDELQALRSQPVQVRLGEVVKSAVELVRPLSRQFGVKLLLRLLDPDDDLVVVDRSVLNQVLAQLLSWAIQAASNGSLLVIGCKEMDKGAVHIRFRGDPARLPKERLQDVLRIASSQGIECDVHLDEPGSAHLSLRMRASQPFTVLVVEDNTGAVELYRRYLSPGNWQVHAVSDPRAACDVARTLKPDVIVLDIMMPRMDGWTVLELLSRQPDAAKIPVIVCSVTQDSQLSQSLGARAYLTKPVARGEFLAALKSCLGARRVSQ